MKIKNKFQLTLIVIFLSGIIGVGYYFLFSKINSAGNTVADDVFGWEFPVAKFPPVGSGSQFAYSSIRLSPAIPTGLPVRLKIPIIGVDSAIEDAFITPEGRMDVPAGSVNVAWFALGPHPGDVGSAVIGGHFGIRNGVKFVFFDLDKLKIGDKVYIVNDRGETLAFQVRLIKLFDRTADATTVFTSSDGLAHLNLITCEGIWNKTNGNYPERRVVFTDLIKEVKIVDTIIRPSFVKLILAKPALPPIVKPALPSAAIITPEPAPFSSSFLPVIFLLVLIAFISRIIFL